MTAFRPDVTWENARFCDGCGTIMLDAPVIRHLHGDRSFEFDSFTCYERVRGALGLTVWGRLDDVPGTSLHRGLDDLKEGSK